MQKSKHIFLEELDSKYANITLIMHAYIICNTNVTDRSLLRGRVVDFASTEKENATFPVILKDLIEPKSHLKNRILLYQKEEAMLLSDKCRTELPCQKAKVPVYSYRYTVSSSQIKKNTSLCWTMKEWKWRTQRGLLNWTLVMKNVSLMHKKESTSNGERGKPI